MKKPLFFTALFLHISGLFAGILFILISGRISIHLVYMIGSGFVSLGLWYWGWRKRAYDGGALISKSQRVVMFLIGIVIIGLGIAAGIATASHPFGKVKAETVTFNV